MSRIPITSVSFADKNVSASRRDQIYLIELDRQAETASKCFGHAFTQSLHTTDEADALVWSELQAALFASIVVYRVLWPVEDASKQGTYPPLTKAESAAYRTARGQRLRDQLAIEESSPLKFVKAIRDSFEHVDERLDSMFAASAASFTDWHITHDGTFIERPKDAEPDFNASLRTYFPEGGLLQFDWQFLDLFQLDTELLNLRRQIKEVRKSLPEATGRALFGVSKYTTMSPEKTLGRAREWLRIREESGAGLNLRVDPPNVDEVSTG